MDNKQTSVHQIYYGSDGGATRKLMTRLKKAGTLGAIAAQLFRAQKASSRAKKYRGGIRHSTGDFSSYRGLAYEKKEESLSDLCSLLETASQGLTWGWKPDVKQPHAKFILYVDLPNGQVSFHAPTRFAGPDYHGEWDGKRASFANRRWTQRRKQRQLEAPNKTSNMSARGWSRSRVAGSWIPAD